MTPQRFFVGRAGAAALFLLRTAGFRGGDAFRAVDFLAAPAARDPFFCARFAGCAAERGAAGSGR